MLQVELLVMKALSVGLVKGSIDEVDKRVHMTWVQPRVLDLQQVMATGSSGAGGRRPGSDPGAGKGPGLGMSPLGAWLCPGVFRRDGRGTSLVTAPQTPRNTEAVAVISRRIQASFLNA